MTTPSRLINGLATVPPGKPLADYPHPDPFHTSGNALLGVATYINEFNTLIGTDYTVTGAASTFTLSNTVVGGGAVLTPGGAAVASSAYKNGSFCQFIAGQKFWFITRFQLSAVAAPTAYVGLQAGAATTAGLWFSMAAGGVISLVSTVNSVATTLVANVATATAAGWVDVAFYYNGVDLLVYSADGLVARVTAPTIGATGTTLTNAILTPVFQITPTATDTLTADYILVAQEVTR